MRQARVTAWYTLSHFATDLACAFFLFRCTVTAREWAPYLLLYNAVAFGMQMPLGLLCDRRNRNALAAAVGLLLTACGCLFTKTPFLLATVAGLGNALFHLGGGLDVMNGCKGKAGALGVFVSSGAIGLFLGKLMGKAGGIPAYAVGAALLLLAVLTPFAVQGRRVTAASDNASPALPEKLPRACVAAALLLLVVVLRSYTGFTAAGDKAGVWGVLAVAAAAGGKAAGGFVCDALGKRRAAVVQLSLAAVLFVFSKTPVCFIAALFCFNMTMPVTLAAAARVFAGMKGFGFGLLTFGLFLGFLPTALGFPWAASGPWGLALLTAASLGLLLLAFATEDGHA